MIANQSQAGREAHLAVLDSETMSNRCNYFRGDGWACVVLESVVLGGDGRASGT
jgi:hypothetical protein